MLDQSNLATLYVSKEYPLPKYSHHSYPDGFLHTSNEDMGLYLKEMIKGAKGEGALLADASYKTLFERQSPRDLELGEGEVHSIFWDLHSNGRIEHSGADPGIISFLSFDPIRETGYFIMANINDGGLGNDLGVNSDQTFEQLFKILELVSEFEAQE